MNETSKGLHISDFRNVFHWLLCFVAVFAAGTFQTSFFGSCGLFAATPDLLLATVGALAVSGGEKKGAVSGIAAGVLAASLGGSGTMLMPLFYCLEGWILGTSVKNDRRTNVLSWTAYMLAACTARSSVSLLYLFFSENSLNLPAVFKGILIPEWLLTLLFSYVSYLIPVFAYKLSGRGAGGNTPI